MYKSIISKSFSETRYPKYKAMWITSQSNQYILSTNLFV
jgi:hypothetical protein